MKNMILLLLTVATLFTTSCRRMTASYDERLQGVKAVCKTCNFVTSEGWFYAVDTAKQPNVIYKVTFKSGGVFFKASDVDHLTRIN